MLIDDDLILLGDNQPLLEQLPSDFFQLIYIDPPFNTGKDQTRRSLRTERHHQGDRLGFQGRRYVSTLLRQSSYRDAFEDYLAFLEPRLIEARRLLTPTAPSTSTSTTARLTTASSCSTGSSAASAS